MSREDGRDLFSLKVDDEHVRVLLLVSVRRVSRKKVKLFARPSVDLRFLLPIFPSLFLRRRNNKRETRKKY